MAYSQNFPAQRPSFMFDASNSGRIPPNMTYTRASTANVFDGAKHLSSENLLPYSNNVSSSEWTKSRVTVDSVNNSSPDGGSDASLILETADTGSHTYYDGFSGVSGQNYSFTIYAKANGRTKFILSPQATAVIANVEFDLTAVTATVTSGATVGTPTITAIGSTGWYKCAVTVTATATGTGYTQVSLVDGSGNSSYAGDVTKGVYVWGHQISSTGETVLNETSGSIHREYASSLVSKANNIGRFEVGVDGQSMGLLVESQSANLLTNSADFGGSWQLLNATKELAAIGPDGTLSAIAFRENEGAGSKRLLRYYTHSGTDFTISVYAKLLGNTRRLVLREAQSSGLQTVFDLASGSVVTGTGSIKSVGNGWFRCQLNGSHSTTNHAAAIHLVGASSDGSDVNSGYTGDGYSGLLLAYPQAEDQSFASSYIDTGTGGSTATRAADSLSVATADIGYTGGPVSVVAEFEAKASTTQYVGVLSNTGYGIYTSYANLYQDAADTVRIDVNGSGGASDARGDATVASSAGSRKIAARYENDNYGLCVDGGTVATDTSGTLPVFDKLDVGSYADGGSVNSTIKRIALYGSLTDTNLQALTS